MKLVIAIIAGVLLAFPTARAAAQPVDCEAARCAVQSAIDTECSCAEAKNHGRYTACVSRVVNRLVREGMVPKKCRTKINGCAIRSTCGKRDGSVSCQLPGSAVTSRCRPLSSETACTSRGGTVVASCCETCNGPVPTATPTEALPTPTATEEPVATPTATDAVATATPEPEVTATATEVPVPTTTPTEVPVPTATETPVATATETPVATATEPPATATATPEATATETPVATETSTPVASATETPAATATVTPAVTATSTPVATATTTPVPTTTATLTPVATATATQTPVATATATRTATPTATPTATRTATPSVTATATPVPTATSTPSGPVCGNGTVESGEQCDPPGSGTCDNAGNGLETCSLGCTCACPTKIKFTGDASDPLSILDTGWTGFGHRAPIISNGNITVALSNCTSATRPCGTCTLSGPIRNPNAGAGDLDNQRCTNDTSIRCTNNTPCMGGGGTCQFYFGSNLPLAAGGVTTCVVNQFNGPLTGTANIESGESANTALLTARVYLGLVIDSPCARCIGDAVINDGVLGGTCSGGLRDGLSCDGNGAVANRPDFGITSLDCPLAAGALVATLPIDLSNATDPVTKTLTTSNPTCGGEPTERCLCDTCNNANAESCDDNSDCPDPAGAIGPICGGRRCIAGANLGAACNNNTQCPGSQCARKGEPTKPSACLDDTATVGVLDCADGDGDGEGECSAGPITSNCSVASGHAQRGCGNDADCGGAVGSCESANRKCFLTGGFTGKVGSNTLTAAGMEDPPVDDVSHPTLGAVFCVGATNSDSVNTAAGLPGAGRVTIRGTALGLP